MSRIEWFCALFDGVDLFKMDGKATQFVVDV